MRGVELRILWERRNGGVRRDQERYTRRSDVPSAFVPRLAAVGERHRQGLRPPRRLCGPTPPTQSTAAPELAPARPPTFSPPVGSAAKPSLRACTAYPTMRLLPTSAATDPPLRSPMALCSLVRGPSWPGLFYFRTALLRLRPRPDRRRQPRHPGPLRILALGRLRLFPGRSLLEHRLLGRLPAHRPPAVLLAQQRLPRPWNQHSHHVLGSSPCRGDRDGAGDVLQGQPVQRRVQPAGDGVRLQPAERVRRHALHLRLPPRQLHLLEAATSRMRARAGAAAVHAGVFRQVGGAARLHCRLPVLSVRPSPAAGRGGGGLLAAALAAAASIASAAAAGSHHRRIVELFHVREPPPLQRAGDGPAGAAGCCRLPSMPFTESGAAASSSPTAIASSQSTTRRVYGLYGPHALSFPPPPTRCLHTGTPPATARAAAATTAPTSPPQPPPGVSAAATPAPWGPCGASRGAPRAPCATPGTSGWTSATGPATSQRAASPASCRPRRRGPGLRPPPAAGRCSSPTGRATAPPTARAGARPGPCAPRTPTAQSAARPGRGTSGAAAPPPPPLTAPPRRR